MKIKDYKDLNIWQKGISIVDDIYQITKSFPKEELYGLTNQMHRAAVSIPSNIAEGFVRRYSKEYSYFLSVALGSCAELDTQLIIAEKRGFICKDDLLKLTNEIAHEMKMISSLKRML